MRCLILGSNGFIGTHLANFLVEKKNEVIGLDNDFHPCLGVPRNFRTIKGDVRNRELMDELISETDMVFHLAAIIHVDYSIKYPYETYDVNCLGTINVLEACQKYDKRLIFASSSEVYGTAQADFISETHPLDGQSPYAVSKIFGDRMCKAYIDTYEMPIVILRNFNTFGPGQSADEGAGSSYGSVIPIFVKRALMGEDLLIFGNGEQERDYMWIDDALRGYELCMREDLRGQVINIGMGRTIKIIDLAKKIIELTGSRSKIKFVEPRPGEVRRLCAGIVKAKSYGFNPVTDFERDLKKFIDWYRNDLSQKEKKYD